MAGLCAIGQMLAVLAMAPGLLALGSRAADVGAPPSADDPVAPVLAVEADAGACVGAG